MASRIDWCRCCLVMIRDEIYDGKEPNNSKKCKKILLAMSAMMNIYLFL